MAFKSDQKQSTLHTPLPDDITAEIISGDEIMVCRSRLLSNCVIITGNKKESRDLQEERVQTWTLNNNPLQRGSETKNLRVCVCVRQLGTSGPAPCSALIGCPVVKCI